MDLPVAIVSALLIVGAALLAALTARWVPAVAATPVAPGDVDRDFSAAEQERERALRRRVRPPGLIAVGLGVLVPTAIVVTGVASAVADLVAGPWWADVVVVTTLVLGADRLASLPCAVLVRRESLRAGIAAGTWGRWSRDVALAWVLGWLLTCAALVGWVGAVRLLPDAWWWVLALAALALAVLLSFVLPVVVEPLFARFEPLPDGPLRRRLLDLADAAAVPVRDVLVADASRRTRALNAYVSGLGPTRRIVVHDTLLARERDDEVAAVVAHELGHVAAHDVRTGTVLGAGGAALGVLAAALALTWGPVLSVAHVSGPADPAVAAALVAAGAWAGLLGSPLRAAVSRRMERRADAFCLDLARDPAVVASMHRALAVTNLAPLRPVRLLHVWFGTHPTSPERIAAARAWSADQGHGAVPDLRPAAHP